MAKKDEAEKAAEKAAEEAEEQEQAERLATVEEIEYARARDKELADLQHAIKLERGQIPPDPEPEPEPEPVEDEEPVEATA